MRHPVDVRADVAGLEKFPELLAMSGVFTDNPGYGIRDENSITFGGNRFPFHIPIGFETLSLVRIPENSVEIILRLPGSLESDMSQIRAI